MGIGIERVEVDVRGDLDLRDLMGVSDKIRPGFGDIEIEVQISGPETAETYETRRRAVEEQCPVLDVFANKVPVQNSVSVE